MESIITCRRNNKLNYLNVLKYSKVIHFLRCLLNYGRCLICTIRICDGFHKGHFTTRVSLSPCFIFLYSPVIHTNETLLFITKSDPQGIYYIYIYIYIYKGKSKGKDHPRTGHEGPEEE
jgi:hypothetical protein